MQEPACLSDHTLCDLSTLVTWKIADVDINDVITLMYSQMVMIIYDGDDNMMVIVIVNL